MNQARARAQSVARLIGTLESFDARLGRLEAVLLDRPQEGEALDVAAVARRLGVSRNWVYRHADELGGRRLGDGSRPRWRFDAEAVDRYVRGQRS